MTRYDNKIIGQKFGLLTVVELYNTDKGDMCKCICDCGNEKITLFNNLKYSKVKSCGCLRSKSQIKDITGQRFGRLIAIKRTGKKKNNSQVWECKCDCGNVCEVPSGYLNSGGTKSCGCLLRESGSRAIKKAIEIRKDYYIDGTDVYQLSRKCRPNNTSGVVGVYYDKSTKRWKARIGFKKKQYYLGSSKDINVAIKLRKDAEESLHGKFLDWYYKQKEFEKKDKL